MTGVLASFRFLLSDLLGVDDSPPPRLPNDLPPDVRPVVAAAIELLIDYQGPGYAQLYLDRLHRFSRRRGVDAQLLGEIARLLAHRMSYRDPIRCAQIALVRTGGGLQRGGATALWLEDIVASLPARIFEIPVIGYNWASWCRASTPFRVSAAGRWGRCRLRALASLRRWRLFSARYAVERVWVERWLHMIDRALVKQPQAVASIVRTATMLYGDGAAYREAVANWHAIIDGLVKPALDGRLALPDLAAAVDEAQASAARSPRDGASRSVAAIRARAAANGVAAKSALEIPERRH